MSRAVSRLIVLVLVVAALAVVADRVAASVAARAVSQGLTSSQRLGRPATVRFDGVPFLTQTLRGRYETVEVTMQGLPTTSGLVVDRVDATLHGVSAPALPLLRGQVTSLPVERGEATVSVSFDALAAAVARSVGTRATTLTLARAAADRVAVSGTVRTLLGTFTLRGQAKLSVAKGVMAVRLLPETITGVPAILRARVAPQVNLTALVPPLPFGFRATAVTVEPSGLRLQAAGTGLALPTRSGPAG